MVRLGGYGERGVDAALGRPAAARGARARHRLRAAHPADGRAALARSTRSCASRCRSRSRQLHEQLGMTTVYVTHDQREALTMSDRIAVIERGRDRCSSTRRGDLYERPANALRRRVHRRVDIRRRRVRERRSALLSRADVEADAAAAPHGAAHSCVAARAAAHPRRDGRARWLNVSTGKRAERRLPGRQLAASTSRSPTARDRACAQLARQRRRCRAGPARCSSASRTADTVVVPRRRLSRVACDARAEPPRRPERRRAARERASERSRSSASALPGAAARRRLHAAPVAWLFWLSFLADDGDCTLEQLRRLLEQPSYRPHLPHDLRDQLSLATAICVAARLSARLSPVAAAAARLATCA